MRWLFLGALLGFVGCHFPEGLTGVESFTPPPWYRPLWERLQICTGAHRDFTTLEFYVAEEIRIDGERHRAGHWRGHVYLAPAYVDDEFTVAHELTHVLIGDGKHERGMIWTRCAFGRSEYSDSDW
jgi:hypothetical protein